MNHKDTLKKILEESINGFVKKLSKKHKKIYNNAYFEFTEGRTYKAEKDEGMKRKLAHEYAETKVKNYEKYTRKNNIYE